MFSGTAYANQGMQPMLNSVGTEILKTHKNKMSLQTPIAVRFQRKEI
jgi:hypothetical protein